MWLSLRLPRRGGLCRWTVTLLPLRVWPLLVSSRQEPSGPLFADMCAVEVAAILLPPPPPPTSAAPPTASSSVSSAIPPVPSASSAAVSSVLPTLDDELVGDLSGDSSDEASFEEILDFFKKEFPGPFSDASYQTSSRYAKVMSWSDFTLSRRPTPASSMLWSSGMVAECAGLSEMVLGSSSASGVAPLLPPRLLPVPSRRSRRWYRASRPYSGDSFPVPREIESLLPESARSTFKRKSPSCLLRTSLPSRVLLSAVVSMFRRLIGSRPVWP